MGSSKSRNGRGIQRKHGSVDFYVHLTLLSGRDDDLIAELNATPMGQLSAKMREMLRTGISSGRFVAEENESTLSIEMGDVGLDL